MTTQIPKFYKFEGEVIEDVYGYVKKFMAENKGARIIVGCDSDERKNRKTKKLWIHYATIIGLFYPNRRGCHLIYSKDSYTIKQRNDIFTKIWGEVERIKNVAEYLTENGERDGIFPRNPDGTKFVRVHIDVNPIKKFKSNMLISAATGYFEGFQYIVDQKPGASMSSNASDKLCRI